MKRIFTFLIILLSLNIFAQNSSKDPFGLTYDSDRFSVEDKEKLSTLLQKFNLNLNELINIKSHSKDYYEFIKTKTHHTYIYTKEGNNISLESFTVKRKNKELNKYYSIFSDEKSDSKKIILVIF